MTEQFTDIGKMVSPELDIAEQKQQRELEAEVLFFRDVVSAYQAGIDVSSVIEGYIRLKQEQLCPDGEHCAKQSEDPKEYKKRPDPHYSDKGSHKKRSDYWKAERKKKSKV